MSQSQTFVADAVQEAADLKALAAGIKDATSGTVSEHLDFCKAKSEEYKDTNCTALKEANTNDQFCDDVQEPTSEKMCCKDNDFKDSCEEMGCCDVCHNPTDNTSGAYKARCTEEHFEGVLICGATSDEDADTSGTLGGQCTTEGSVYIDAEEYMQCGDGLSDMSVIHDVLRNRNGLSWNDYSSALAEDKAVLDVFFPKPEEQKAGVIWAGLRVVNGDNTTTPAALTLDSKGWTNCSQPLLFLVQGIVEGDIVLNTTENTTLALHNYIARPHDGKGPSLLGGTLYLLNVTNSAPFAIKTQGPLLMSGVTNLEGGNVSSETVTDVKAFISNTTNYGTVTVGARSEIVIIDTVNGESGEIKAGSGVFRIYDTTNSGTLTADDVSATLERVTTTSTSKVELTNVRPSTVTGCQLGGEIKIEIGPPGGVGTRRDEEESDEPEALRISNTTVEGLLTVLPPSSGNVHVDMTGVTLKSGARVLVDGTDCAGWTMEGDVSGDAGSELDVRCGNVNLKVGGAVSVKLGDGVNGTVETVTTSGGNCNQSIAQNSNVIVTENCQVGGGPSSNVSLPNILNITSGAGGGYEEGVLLCFLLALRMFF